MGPHHLYLSSSFANPNFNPRLHSTLGLVSEVRFHRKRAWESNPPDMSGKPTSGHLNALTPYTSMPYSEEEMIAEIVSLPGYESQVAALLTDEERMAMEFFIACAPEDHPVIPGSGGFRKARWSRRGEGRRLSSGLFLPGRTGTDLYGCDLRQIAKGHAFGGGSEALAKPAAQIKKAVK